MLSVQLLKCKAVNNNNTAKKDSYWIRCQIKTRWKTRREEFRERNRKFKTNSYIQSSVNLDLFRLAPQKKPVLKILIPVTDS